MPGRIEPQLCWNVAAVEHDHAVCAPLDDGGDGQRRISIECVPGANEPGSQAASLDRRGLIAGIAGVAYVFLHRCVAVHVARHTKTGFVVKRKLVGAFALQRQGQADHFGFHVGAKLQRGWQRIELRHCKRRAVRQHAAGACQAELAQRKQALVDLELHKAPGVDVGTNHARINKTLDVAKFLLKMVRLEEHALGPDDTVAPAHQCWLINVCRSIQSKRPSAPTAHCPHRRSVAQQRATSRVQDPGRTP